MRLLNSRTLELAEFIGEHVPAYAILSHTWDEEEVTLRDMYLPGRDEMKGWSKILACCRQATQDDLDWVWVDTCCIDKSSSAELSEAINSMFRWYRDASVCYAYLSDVPPLHPFLDDAKFNDARWFTRGWCLQELIAPRNLEFYAQDWTEVGTKRSLQAHITNITAIPAEVLLHKKDPSQCPVAQRMSWASKRSTTRVEDVAYSLLGIFDLNMPLLYGEGRRAFLRLQEEIIKRERDYTMFLWSRPGPRTDPDGIFRISSDGIFSDSPQRFSSRGIPLKSGHFCAYADISLVPPYQIPSTIVSPTVAAGGIRIRLLAKQDGRNTMAWMNCYGKGVPICIFVQRSRTSGGFGVMGRYARLLHESDPTTWEPRDLHLRAFANPRGGDDEHHPTVPPDIRDFVLTLRSTPTEKLSFLDICPTYSVVADSTRDAITVAFSVADWPNRFAVLFGVERGDEQHQFIITFSLRLGTCVIHSELPIRPLKEYLTMKAAPGPPEGPSDRAITRLAATGNYLTVASKRRAHKHCAFVSLLPAPGDGDGPL